MDLGIPAQPIGPGERTGVFRVGGDELLTDADGSSRIAIPDYVAGIIDQLENLTAHRKQITLPTGRRAQPVGRTGHGCGGATG